MIGRLVVRSIRTRATAHLAAGLVTLTGSALLSSFGSLMATGIATDDGNQGLLVLLPAILGGWTVVIVAYGIVSTVGLAVQQRAGETALLRLVGMTPRQVQAMVMVESLVVAAPMAALGVVPGQALGGFLLGRLVDAGAVTGPVALVGGWFPAGIGVGVSLLAAGAGSWASGRAAAIAPPVRALAGHGGGPSGAVLGRGRLIVGGTLVVAGLGLGVGTLFMADGPLLSSTAGPAGVATAAGLALLSPAGLAALGRLTASAPGVTGRLAARNLSADPGRFGAAAGPIVLLVGIATGTLFMQTTEDSTAVTRAADPGVNLAPVNYLIVTIIVAFACIAVTNSLVSATRGRSREFELLRLAGATHRQVLSVTLTEVGLLVGLAVALGAAAALVTTVPFSLVRTGSPVAVGPAWMFPAVVAGTLLIALLATMPTAARMAGAGARER